MEETLPHLLPSPSRSTPKQGRVLLQIPSPKKIVNLLDLCLLVLKIEDFILACICSFDQLIFLSLIRRIRIFTLWKTPLSLLSPRLNI